MDLYTLLLIIFFIVIPLIQQIMEKRKGQLPPPEDIEEGVEPTRRRTEGARGAGGGWSGDWGEWPSQEEEVEVEWEPWQAEPRGEALPAPAPEPAPTPRPSPAPSPEVRPEPVPRWEQVRIEVKREERPVLVRPDLPRVVSLEELEPTWTSTPRRVPAALSAVPGHRRKSTRAERLIRSREGLRAAIILSEVLGPPRSLRPPIEDRG